jgi:hypothetical protein
LSRWVLSPAAKVFTMTKAEKMRRYRQLVREQRNFLDQEVPRRLAANPSWNYRSDAEYARRSEELDRLASEFESGELERGA